MTISTLNNLSDDYIQVWVPRRLYPVVLRLLADEMTEPEAAPQPFRVTPPSAPASAGPRKVPWTESEVAALVPFVSDLPTVVALFDQTTDTPGVFLGFKDVRQTAGRSHGEARAELAQLSHVIRKHFHRDNWPIQVKKGPGGLMLYQASPEFAAVWKKTKK